MEIMSERGSTRREFVRWSTGALGSGWVALNVAGVSALAACAREAARSAEPFQTLTAMEGAAMRALAARIIPSDDTLPGAEEAGAAYFMDGALTTWFPEMLEPVRAGIAEMEAAAMAKGGAFADLDVDAQDAVIREIEGGPFFQLARTLTILGVFSDPRYGGGRDHVGERILGLTHQPSWTAPFGEYDAEVRAGTGGAA